MALDEKLRRQLIVARENISTQLTQLEGARMDPYASGGMPDVRNVYADLQRELREIDRLLDAKDDENGSNDAKSAYEPMVQWNPDGTVGNPTGPTRAAIILAIVSLGLIVVWVGLRLFMR
jgi:hypothetical protein